MARRTLIGALAALAVIGSGALPAGAAAASSPWSQTGSNAAMSRANLTETTLSATSIRNVAARRRLSTPPDDGCGQAFAAPILAGGKVYVAAQHGVSAYNAATGQRLWHTTLDTIAYDYFGYLGLAGGRLVVGVEDCISQSDPDGYVVALNPGTGASIWQTSLPGPLMSMVVSGGYVVTAGDSIGGGSELTALRTSTGTVAWSKYGDCGDYQAIVVAGKVIYAGCDATDTTTPLSAYALATGTLSWQRSGSWSVLRGDNDGVTTGHHIYAANGSGVNDLNPKNGATRFVLSGANDVIADDAHHVYATCNQTSVCAYDTTGGTLQWTRTGLGAQSSAAAANGLFYSVNGQVVASATGRTVRILPYTAAELVVGDGRIAVVNPSGRYLTLYGLPGS